MERRGTQRLFLLLAGYFLLQLIIRLFVSPELELDEAEQMLLTQQISLGYGPQPPLYTWILSGVFFIFGAGIFSLALLKNLLLFLTYWFTYRAARCLGYSRDVSAAAMLSLLFVPQIVWESQRDLTHSVLSVTVAAATIVCWVRIQKDQSTVNYLLMGVCWGIGILSKYNYGIFLLALLCASVGIPEYRPVLRNRRMLYTIAVFTVIVTPHLYWAATHVTQLMASSKKFKIAIHTSYPLTVLKGTGSLIGAVVAFAGLLAAVYAAVWFRRRRSVECSLVQKPAGAVTLLPVRMVLASLCICLVMVIVFKVTFFKDRWMQPILFFLPLALLPFMKGRLTLGAIRIPALIAAVSVIAGMAFRPQLGVMIGEVTRFNLPFRELTGQLAPDIRSADIVITHLGLLGGNLRLHQPGVRVTLARGSRLFHETSPARTLVVWNDEITPEQSEEMWQLVRKLMGSSYVAGEQRTVEAGYRYIPGRRMRLYAVAVSRSPAGAAGPRVGPRGAI